MTLPFVKEKAPESVREATAFLTAPCRDRCVPGLARTRELLERLGNPQRRLRFIHVAGTNGKGSVSTLLASVLRTEGYRVGLNLSPTDLYAQRIQVDGPIDDASLLRLTRILYEETLRMKEAPTRFELTTVLSFLYFVEKKCDFVVLETGLGGRLDSTNVIDPPLLAIITNIDLDHTEILGNTIPAIAGEKAGILKTGSCAVFQAQHKEAAEVLRARAESLRIPYRFVNGSAVQSGTDFWHPSFTYCGQTFSLHLRGRYQAKNAALVLEAVEALREQGVRLSDDALRVGLQRAFLPGRLEVVSEHPLRLLDGAHNPAAVRILFSSLDDYFPQQRFDFLIGVFADKAHGEMFRTLPQRARSIHCITAPGTRGLPAEALCAEIRPHAGSVPVFAHSNVQDACRALKNSNRVLCFGSLSILAEVRKIWREMGASGAPDEALPPIYEK